MNAILDRVNTPDDLKGLSLAELEVLSGEVRERIIDTVSRTGGHLAANLGVVELTVALLRVFDPPGDKLVWDTGHQTYAYKLLTGRKDRFDTLRQVDGISGFLKRSESPYDVFGAGHAGTAVSAALGVAVARDQKQGHEHVVAILGDAAAGCGVTFEALNNLSGTTSRLIVVLNDNEMSIAQNVGSMSRYLGGLLANPRYNRWKRSVEDVARRMHMDPLRSLYYRIEEAVKSLFLPNVVFEEFGMRYVGPVNGHNLHALVDALTVARESNKPILVHVSTRKGYGYRPAEEHPETWHGTSPFDVATGLSPKNNDMSYSDVFGRVLVRLAEQDPRIVGITAAMCAGTGMKPFATRFPDRFFDVGISEEHAVLFAAGLSTEGLMPIFAVYSTFLQRAVDYVIHDVCLQDLPVVLCLDRAGVVGDDGPTHHGVFDLALLRPVPGLVIMQPRDEAELANMLYTATRLGKPVVIRYPRGTGPGAPVPDRFEALPLGKAEVIRPGREVQIWALGDMIPLAEKVAAGLAEDGIQAGVVNPRFVRPLDGALLAEQSVDAQVMVTIENGIIKGGFGSELREHLAALGYSGRVLKFGWPDAFVPQGKPSQLMERYGLTAPDLVSRIRAALT
jgi:1-deoxy-D-xylulose-5-phosphate synthase